MSKGNERRTIRLTKGQLAAIAIAIDCHNNGRQDTFWTFSDFIDVAIREKLEHMRRGGNSKIPRPLLGEY